MALLLLFLTSSLSQSAAAESRPSLQQAVESALNPTVAATLAYDGRMEREKDILCLAATNIGGYPWSVRYVQNILCQEFGCAVASTPLLVAAGLQ